MRKFIYKPTFLEAKYSSPFATWYPATQRSKVVNSFSIPRCCLLQIGLNIWRLSLMKESKLPCGQYSSTTIHSRSIPENTHGLSLAISQNNMFPHVSIAMVIYTNLLYMRLTSWQYFRFVRYESKSSTQRLSLYVPHLLHHLEKENNSKYKSIFNSFHQRAFLSLKRFWFLLSHTHFPTF